MKIAHTHSWQVTLKKAADIQEELAKKLFFEPLIGRVKYIAGADVAYFDQMRRSVGAVTVMKFPELNIVEQTFAVVDVTFPYIPGYLTFREAPVLLKAFEELQCTPDLIIFDGQGIAHRKKMGIAAHLGVLLDIPSIGCAKSRLIGNFDDPAPDKGSFSPLFYHGERIGAVVRTRKGTKPVFVSPGQKITIPEAITWVLKCCPKYRVPEPVRQSHLAVNRFKKKLVDEKKG
ncbi:MAG: deoxyribonuclease V [Calditrichaeota bacterium]|nr:deoxyribonuclease V [Calditrichota bacterium]